MADAQDSTPDVISVRCDDPDAARSVGEDVYHPHRLAVSRSASPFEMRLRAAPLGPVTVGVLGYLDEVRIETDALENSYQINIPLTGSLDCWEGRRHVVADRRTAVIFGPDDPTGFTGFAGGGELLGIKVGCEAIETEFAASCGSPVRRPRLPPTLDVGAGPGAQWWSIARSLVDLLDTPNGLLGNPLVSRPLVRTLVAGLVVAVGAGADPSRAGTAATAPTVRRAADLLEQRASEPVTVSDLAAQVGASVRTLQSGFRRDLGTTPMEYLRRVRLDRAHADLLEGDPTLVTVGEIARRWGFEHLGRFATQHRDRFGVTPSQTLRREV